MRRCSRSFRRSSASWPWCGCCRSPGRRSTTQLWLPDESARALLAILAVATMFVGNLMALRQKHLFRLLAYSSIAHAGYMLVGLAVGNVGVVGGTSAVLFYLATYGLMTIGVFALLRGAGSERASARDDRRPPRPEPHASDDGAAAGRLPVQPHRPAADGRLPGQAEPVLRRLGRDDRPSATGSRRCWR